MGIFDGVDEKMIGMTASLIIVAWVFFVFGLLCGTAYGSKIGVVAWVFFVFGLICGTAHGSKIGYDRGYHDGSKETSFVVDGASKRRLKITMVQVDQAFENLRKALDDRKSMKEEKE